MGFKYKYYFRKVPFLTRWQRRRWSLFMTALAIAVTVMILHQPILKGMASYLVVDNLNAEKADYGLVLAGEFPNRVLEAAQLYREGRIAKILLTDNLESEGIDRLRQMGIDVDDQQRRNYKVLLQLEIPSHDIIRIRGECNSTFAEASRVGRFIGYHNTGTKHLPHLVVITSPTHTRRAYKIFRRNLGNHIQVMVKPTRYDQFLATPWWRERHHLKEVILEYQKLFSVLLQI